MRASGPGRSTPQGGLTVIGGDPRREGCRGAVSVEHRHVHTTSLADIPEVEQRSPSGKFLSFARNISIALGCIRNVGTWGGGHPFDVQVRRLPPGASVCPFHAHLHQWEFFLVRSGRGTVRTEHGVDPVAPGDFFLHPPGEAHQLTNTGAEDLVVLIVADNPALDACYYPDSDKWGLRPPDVFFRATSAHYFDGEDVYDAAQPPPGLLPLPTPTLPWGQRKRNVESLPWDAWTSPKGRFRGESKELSLALGAQRNMPTGAGGHPFDVELGRLAPGESGCPFHSHAAQWELFIFLNGPASVRAGSETREFAAGSVVLHPPGEAHQFRNNGSTPLDYLLIADNPPVDYWHYPDSNKWGLRAPRKFFRMVEADYYDGEE